MNFSAGSGSSNSSEKGVKTPVVPEEWQKTFDALLNNGGTNSDQKFATGVMKDQLSTGGANPALGAIYDQFLSPLMQRGAVTLGGLNDSGNPNYATPTVNLNPAPSAAQTGNVNGVQAPSAASQLGNYNAPVEDVVNSSIADLLHSGDIAQNDLRARYGGTPGGGREQVYAGQQAADTARAVGSVAAQTRLGGYNTNLTAAGSDAARQLAAAQGNQSTDLTKSVTDAQMQQQAAQAAAERDMQTKMFMANLLSGRQTTDLNSANTNTAQQLAAVNAGQNNVQTQQNNTTQLAGNVNQAGGMSIQQLMALLGLGTGTFGSTFTDNKNSSQSGVSGGIG